VKRASEVKTIRRAITEQVAAVKPFRAVVSDPTTLDLACARYSFGWEPIRPTLTAPLEKLSPAAVASSPPRGGSSS